MKLLSCFDDRCSQMIFSDRGRTVNRWPAEARLPAQQSPDMMILPDP